MAPFCSLDNMADLTYFTATPTRKLNLSDARKYLAGRDHAELELEQALQPLKESQNAMRSRAAERLLSLINVSLDSVFVFGDMLITNAFRNHNGPRNVKPQEAAARALSQTTLTGKPVTCNVLIH